MSAARPRPPRPPLTPSGRFASVRHALAGLRLMLTGQHNAKLHAAATAGVAVLGFAVGLSAAEWCWVIAACVGVWVAEGLNTAFELLCDVASPGYHPGVKQAKDVAAGAVLVASLGAAAVGALVFGPHLLALTAAR